LLLLDHGVSCQQLGMWKNVIEENKKLNFKFRILGTKTNTLMKTSAHSCHYDHHYEW